MDRLPSNIMFDIFSNVPAKCLARSRCVSKLWCQYIDDRYLMTVYAERVIEEPIPILYHFHERITCSLCFHGLESLETRDANLIDVLMPKEGPFLEFLQRKPLSRSSIVRIKVRGSCNGLMCLSQDEDDIVTSLIVVHPLKKECYELPPLPMRFDSSMSRESCGLGFDASTNTLKMICVLLKDSVPPGDLNMVRKNLCTMVHVFGTNSWREIPQVPPYCITDGAVFANGCLHWLVGHVDNKTEDAGRPVIWFDVEKEEFGLIDRPKRMCDLWINSRFPNDNLVDLNGEVGYVCARAMEVWILKQKEWVAHFRFEKEIFPYVQTRVLGCWNKDGDMLVTKHLDNHKWPEFFVYNLKSGFVHKTKILYTYAYHPLNIFMHPNKLFSIRGIGTNSFPMRKTDLRKSCEG